MFSGPKQPYNRFESDAGGLKSDVLKGKFYFARLLLRAIEQVGQNPFQERFAKSREPGKLGYRQVPLVLLQRLFNLLVLRAALDRIVEHPVKLVAIRSGNGEEEFAVAVLPATTSGDAVVFEIRQRGSVINCSPDDSQGLMDAVLEVAMSQVFRR
jgi:hypothetical protein